ncbi:MAG: PQQ-binding-like beta-propeller repeat protein [Candidatus Bathyarchaeia archaeon]
MKVKSKTVFTIALSALLFVMMFTALHVPPAKAQPTPVFPLSPLPVVYVDPSAITADAGQQFNVSIYVNSTVELDLYAFQMNVTWTNDILNYESATWGDEGANMTKSGAMISISSDGTGQLQYAGGPADLYVAVTSVNSPLKLFTVTFKGISAGTSPIKLINVELFGISDDGNGWPPSTSVFNGIPEFTQYDRWPDVNHDGMIQIFDALIVSNAAWTSPGQKNWNPACDFNGDNVVDFFDWLILSADFGKTNGEPTWPSPAYPLGLTNTIYEFNETVQDGIAYVTDEWPMFHHDLTHTAYSTSTAPNTNQTLWSAHALTTTGNYVTSSPAVAGGIVYVGSNDYHVYALNATTGTQVWSYATRGMVRSSPAVAGGVVYVGSDDNNVYALNATTGTLVWSYTKGDSVHSPAVAGDVVYVGSVDGNVYALNASNGALIWSYTTGNYVDSSPAVAGGVIYVGSDDNKTYALNATTGTPVWIYTTGDWVWSSPAVAGGVVYVGSQDGEVYALNAATGAFVWAYMTGSAVDSSPAVVGGVVYVASDDNNVYALNAVTGALVWNYTTGSWVSSSPAVAGGIVYVGSSDHNVYALNASNGALIWSYTTGNYVFSSPAVAGGVVFVGSLDGEVYAFGVHYDVAVTNVAPSKTVVGQGFSATINVTVADQGDFTETFNVTAFANATIIGSENVTLPGGSSTTVTFTWNTTGFAYGNYTISAYAWPVPGETNTADNNLTGGTVEVTIPGDVDGNGRVNILDAILVSNAFLATPSSSNWNPNADINGDGVVNILDSIIQSNNWTG